MRKAYILNSCSTCQRIIKELDWQEEVQNIKEKNVSAKDLESDEKEDWFLRRPVQ